MKWVVNRIDPSACLSYSTLATIFSGLRHVWQAYGSHDRRHVKYLRTGGVGRVYELSDGHTWPSVLARTWGVIFLCEYGASPKGHDVHPFTIVWVFMKPPAQKTKGFAWKLGCVAGEVPASVGSKLVGQLLPASPVPAPLHGEYTDSCSMRAPLNTNSW